VNCDVYVWLDDTDLSITTYIAIARLIHINAARFYACLMQIIDSTGWAFSYLQ